MAASENPGMKLPEQIQMMERCAEEISSLRRQIDVLTPKAEAYDAMVQLLGMMPRRPQSMGEDMVRTLRKRIAELKPKAND